MIYNGVTPYRNRDKIGWPVIISVQEVPTVIVQDREGTKDANTDIDIQSIHNIEYQVYKYEMRIWKWNKNKLNSVEL